MPPFNPIGGKSKTTIFQSESHKLHIEFPVLAANTVKQGMPVKLDPATGKILPWAKNDKYYKCIGYVVTPYTAVGDNFDMATVAVKGYMTILALSGAALAAGPVSYQSFDSSTEVQGVKGFSVYNAPDQVSGPADDQEEVSGWNLEPQAAANVVTRILVKP